MGKDALISAGDGVCSDADGLTSKLLSMESKTTASSNKSSNESGFIGEDETRLASAATFKGLIEGAGVLSAGTTSSSLCVCVMASSWAESDELEGSKFESLSFNSS